ncbi:MAG: replication-associated recombination protein A [Magnetococcales bacterium]|nr:replication-associated recombination protein A [Magnetococcales bacterium]
MSRLALATQTSPLADRMRPKTLAEVMGQGHLTAKGKLLYEALEKNRIPSLILWGPPGCGKTTIARVIANKTKYRFESLSAVLAGVKEVREVVVRARGELDSGGVGTILFVDEIHRFNKGQQDAFLPFVEDGTITLIGATTENPSFELNGALLSRCQVMVLEPLGEDDLLTLLQRAVADKKVGFGDLKLNLAPEVLPEIANQANGDARYSLNLLDSFVDVTSQKIAVGELLNLDDLKESLNRRATLYDKTGEFHYNLISAFHKSLRGSDVDASLYWLARMLHGGEDRLYILRRMVRFASEDIGNADPQALAITLQAKESYNFLGSPEGELALAQAVIYLACAPKSNSAYVAFKKAEDCAKKNGSLPPPAHILNAPTKLMKDLGYGKGYRYAHDYEGGVVTQEYMPEPLKNEQFYQPVLRGYEREIARRLEYWQKLKGSQGEPKP